MLMGPVFPWETGLRDLPVLSTAKGEGQNGHTGTAGPKAFTDSLMSKMTSMMAGFVNHFPPFPDPPAQPDGANSPPLPAAG